MEICTEMVALAVLHDDNVKCQYNGFTIVAKPHDKPLTLLYEYSAAIVRRQQGRRRGNIVA